MNFHWVNLVFLYLIYLLRYFFFKNRANLLSSIIKVSTVLYVTYCLQKNQILSNLYISQVSSQMLFLFKLSKLVIIYYNSINSVLYNLLLAKKSNIEQSLHIPGVFPDDNSVIVDNNRVNKKDFYYFKKIKFFLPWPIFPIFNQHSNIQSDLGCKQTWRRTWLGLKWWVCVLRLFLRHDFCWL